MFITMTKQQSEQVYQLFDKLVDLPSEQQKHSLNTLCNDQLVIDEVSVLLKIEASDQISTAWTKLIGSSQLEGNEQSRPNILAGKQIAQYRLLEEIGRGGMGVVYRAEQCDGKLERQVAIKLIPQSSIMPSTGDLQIEAQLLALVSHPHIAHIYDAGLAEDNTPYIVMEYIDGISIDRYCERNQLSLNKRLALFSQICTTVNDLHFSGIAHRDLKPSNILITVNGEHKLLDFGVAKLLSKNNDTSATTATITEQLERQVTLDYASPEQINGEAVGVCSDIYSLGTLLYWLVSNQLPFDFKSLNITERLQIISKISPVKPSTVIDVRFAKNLNLTLKQSQRQLRGDLDTIILKCLQKEPLRRYSSAKTLSADLTAFLSHQPISARPDNIWYRTQKFVYRYSKAVMVTGALLTGLLVSNVSLYQSKKLTEHEQQVSQAVANVIFDVFDGYNPDMSEGGLTAIDILNIATESIGEKKLNSPNITVMLYARIAVSLTALSHYEQALLVFNKASVIVKQNENDITEESLSYLYLYLGDLYTYLGDLQKATEFTTLAEEHLTKSNSLVKLYHISYLQGKISMQNRSHKDSINYYQRSLELNINDVSYQYDALAGIATNYDLLGQHGNAIKSVNKVFELERQTGYTSVSSSIELYSALGRSYIHLGQMDEGLIALNKSLKLAQRSYGENGVMYALALNDMARYYEETKKYELAVDTYQQSLNIVQDIFGLEHLNTASLKLNLCGSLIDASRSDEAKPLCLHAREIFKNVAPQHNYIANVDRLLSDLEFQKGQFEVALKYAKNSVEHLERIGDDIDYSSLVDFKYYYADKLIKIKYFEEARHQLDGAIDLTNKHLENPAPRLKRLVELQQILDQFK